MLRHSGNGEKKKILVVDDDTGILESLQFLLEDAGYTVITSEDGSIFENITDSQKVNLILLDYWLPKQNGGEITRRLKSSPNTKDIPIIIISASYNVKKITKEAGADDFIPKPYDMDILLQKIEKHTS